MNILVTGGAGFIGSHLVEELVKKKRNKITVLDDLSTGKLENLENTMDKITFWCEDVVLDNKELKETKFDVVYHLAAKRSVPLSFKDPHSFFRTNISGTWNILEHCKDSRIVNISSSSAKKCLSPYAISKKAAEQLTMLFPNSISLRLFNVFGERQADCGAVVPEFAKKMLKGIPPTIYGDGYQSRDFTYVKDVVEAIIDFGESKEKHKVFDIGYGITRSVYDLFLEMGELLNFKGNPIHEDQRPGDVRYSQATYFFEKPKYGFSKGLKRTIKWIEEVMPYG